MLLAIASYYIILIGHPNGLSLRHRRKVKVGQGQASKQPLPQIRHDWRKDNCILCFHALQ